MQKCITWTKNIQKGARYLQDAQIHCGIKEKRLLTHHFSYLIQSFRSLMDNKPAIQYLYGTMPGIHDNIRARRPYLVDWGVIQMIVTSMKRIVVSIILNQCSGKLLIYHYLQINLCTHARQLKAARMHTQKTALVYAHNSVEPLLTLLTNDSGTQRHKILPK